MTTGAIRWSQLLDIDNRQWKNIHILVLSFNIHIAKNCKPKWFQQRIINRIQHYISTRDSGRFEHGWTSCCCFYYYIFENSVQNFRINIHVYIFNHWTSVCFSSLYLESNTTISEALLIKTMFREVMIITRWNKLKGCRTGCVIKGTCPCS